MIYASIIVEAVRATSPRWCSGWPRCMQATLWLAVPTLVYSAPPGDLAEALAIGHERRLGTAFGPPLAYWLADFAFDLAGGRMLGPYLLAQLCVLIRYGA